MKNIDLNQDFTKFTAEELASTHTDQTQENPLIPKDVQVAFGKHLLDFCKFISATL